MFSRKTSTHASKLIQSDDCYFGIFDQSSSVNRPGKWDAEFQEAKRRAGKQEWSALFHLNQIWIDLAVEGSLLSWITLFGGVFKLEVKILPEEPKIEFGEEENERFLGEGNKNVLHCPSGKIVVDSLTQLGSSLVIPLIIITPGIYKVGFICNDDEESKHQLLEDVSLYPSNQGPDWIIYMQREAPAALTI